MLQRLFKDKKCAIRKKTNESKTRANILSLDSSSNFHRKNQAELCSNRNRTLLVQAEALLKIWVARIAWCERQGLRHRRSKTARGRAFLEEPQARWRRNSFGRKREALYLPRIQRFPAKENEFWSEINSAFDRGSARVFTSHVHSSELSAIAFPHDLSSWTHSPVFSRTIVS